MDKTIAKFVVKSLRESLRYIIWIAFVKLLNIVFDPLPKPFFHLIRTRFNPCQKINGCDAQNTDSKCAVFFVIQLPCGVHVKPFHSVLKRLY